MRGKLCHPTLFALHTVVNKRRLPLLKAEPFCYVQAFAHEYIKDIVALAVQRFKVAQTL